MAIALPTSLRSLPLSDDIRPQAPVACLGYFEFTCVSRPPRGFRLYVCVRGARRVPRVSLFTYQPNAIRPPRSSAPLASRHRTRNGPDHFVLHEARHFLGAVILIRSEQREPPSTDGRWRRPSGAPINYDTTLACFRPNPCSPWRINTQHVPSMRSQGGCPERQ